MATQNQLNNSSRSQNTTAIAKDLAAATSGSAEPEVDSTGQFHPGAAGTAACLNNPSSSQPACRPDQSMCLCLFVPVCISVPACPCLSLSVCLPACLPACLSVCLSVCLYVSVCLPLCVELSDRSVGVPVTSLTGLFMNFLVISSASGGSVAENTPTCKQRASTSSRRSSTHETTTAVGYP